MIRQILFAFLALGLTFPLLAQETFPVNGVRDERPGLFAFTNATVFVDAQTKLENATLVIQDGKVLAVGAGVAIPKGAVVKDLAGKFIYPAFIDPYTTYGMPDVKSGGFSWGSREQIQPDTKGPYNANEAVKPEFDAVEIFTKDEKTAKTMREIGFGSVLAYRPDGLVRGTSALVSLSDENENELVLKGRTAAHFSFEKGSSSQYYPVSDMGFVATIRQTYLDADWYAKGGNAEFYDESLEAFNAQKDMPKIFETDGKLAFFRADKIGDEFGEQYIIKGSGDEYQRIEEVKATGAKVIIPLNFPDAYDVDDPYEAMLVSLEDMKHWELAPTNPAALAEAGVEFAFTTADLKKKGDFLQHVRKAVEYGLSEEDALAALTSAPADMLQASDLIGGLQKGKTASFLITSDNIFEDDAKIHENWVQGKRFVISDMDAKDYSGLYALTVDGSDYQLTISGEAAKPKFEFMMADSTTIKVSGSIDKGLVTMTFNPDTTSDNSTADTRLSGWFGAEKSLRGQGQTGDGAWINWSATYEGEFEEDEESEDEEEASEEEKELGKVTFPFVAYGNEELPQQQDMVIRNATVWTNEAEGIMQEADVLIRDGKIAAVGQDLRANGVMEIDGTGKHLTPGIIDEHSHIALTSVNDVATISSMVRMGDVVDSEDINIYRQLAGGVVASQLLHGSANPVGGQSALIKLRWGKAPQDLLIENADGYIKFALGENVKRSSSSNSIRYPQTRMGVEQVYMDGFTRAKEYGEKWAAYKQNGGTPPRKDLAMEAMLEILNSKRFITCHSYVQSEINMLMKVAEQFGFTVNTFTHILEGYKVADKMREHGAGASSFADWWAYKYEVIEAIPHNAAILHEQGVVTAINSDDAEMARRLNQEAAKIVKYGGMSEEDALKLVTLNPAKLLHLDDRMGSIKVGKDADVVLWNDHPLSIYAKAEKTIIEGAVYYDLEKDAEMREAVAAERARLIAKMRDAKNGGAKTQKAKSKSRHHFHCDDMVIKGVNWMGQGHQH